MPNNFKELFTNIRKMNDIRIRGLKQNKRRKEILYWRVLFGGVEIDHNNSLPILRERWKGQKVIFQSVR